MSKQHFLAEGVLAGGSDGFGGDTGELGVAKLIGAVEDEGNETRASGNDLVSKLTGKVVAKGSGAHFGDGEAAGGNDENGGPKFRELGAQNEFGGSLDFADSCVQEDLHLGGAAFGFEHASDFGSRMVAKKLAESFLVKGDAVFPEESNEIGGCEAGERGFGKVRIGGDEILRRGANVGEIAAATARNEYLLADTFGVFEDGDTVAALPCLDGAKQTGGAAAENKDVEGTGQRGLTRLLRFSVKRMTAGGNSRSVEGGWKFGVAEMLEHVGNLRGHYAREGKWRNLTFGEELGIGSFVAVACGATVNAGNKE
jgi:hypothetical protein